MNIPASKTIEYINMRSKKRLNEGLCSWEKIKSELSAIGISAKLFGSMARGNVHDRSDLDVLIFERNGYGYGHILNIVENFAGDIPVDVVFSEELPVHKVERMIEESSL